MSNLTWITYLVWMAGCVAFAVGYLSTRVLEISIHELMEDYETVDQLADDLLDGGKTRSFVVFWALTMVWPISSVWLAFRFKKFLKTLAEAA